MGEQGLSDRARWALRAAVFTMVALAVVVCAVLLFSRYGLSVRAGAYSCVIALLAVASATDVKSRTVPTWVVVALLLLWVATVWFVPVGDDPGEVGHAFAPIVGTDVTAVVLDGLIGGVVVGMGMLVLSVIVEVRAGRASFGGGDIKLLFVMGLYLGLPASLTMLLAACLIAVALAMVVSAIFPERFGVQELEDPFLRLTVPFAPAITLATVIFLVFGPFTLF